MNKKILALVIGLSPFSANAEPYWAQKPVQCGTQDELVAMAVKFGETPKLVFKGLAMGPNGVGYNAQYVLATNDEERTWTLFEMVSEDMSCIIGAGKGFNSVVDNSIKIMYK